MLSGTLRLGFAMVLASLRWAEFVAENPHRTGSIDGQANTIALNVDHFDVDIVADRDAFPWLP